jgi:hypothetical protein
MSEETLKYRLARGLLEQDERMAILVQRVSGVLVDRWFFPHIAGVGLSFNPYVWSEAIDPSAGVLRLVFGLGTRAVDTSSSDYTRLVALNAPMQQVENALTTNRSYAQRKVEILDLETYASRTIEFSDIVRNCPDLPFAFFASRDAKLERLMAEKKRGSAVAWTLTFEKLLTETPFAGQMREMLAQLQRAYQNPIDIEFTANFQPDGSYTINLVQCRPTMVQRVGISFMPTDAIDESQRVLESRGPVIGRSREIFVDRLIYVVPCAYGQLLIKDRYKIARIIGDLSSAEGKRQSECTVLVGPGRWGTSTPSLGVPISFVDIKKTQAVCEIVTMREGLTPDVSLGTHFFNELVETDMLYFALFPERKHDFLNRDLLESAHNRLSELLPEASQWAHVVRVLDSHQWNNGKALRLIADARKQSVVCFRE